MNKRGAYFFVIDALIASSIILLSLIIIFTTYSLRPESSPTLRMVDDYTDFLITTKVKDLGVKNFTEFVETYNITNQDNTLMEQLTEYYYHTDKDTMWNFTREISKGAKGIIPEQRNFAVYINHTLIYTRNSTPAQKADLMLSSKKLSFKRINQTYVYGPVILEVKIWV